MYESPIEIVFNQVNEMFETKMEQDVVKAVMQYDIKVDKDELLKALAYDRGQYDKGYRAGVTAAKERFKELFYRVYNDVI